MTRQTKEYKTIFRIETSSGNITFLQYSEYRNGQFFKLHFTKNDNRECTDIGRSYFRYDSIDKLKKAYKRAAKKLNIKTTTS